MATIVLEPLADAVAHHGAKTPVASILRTKEWALVPGQLRVTAQFSAGVESAKILQRIQDGVGDMLAQNRNQNGVLTDRAKLVRDLMSLARDEGLTDASAPDSKRITDIGSERRTQLIVDMQTQQAYGYADWKSGQDPDALDAAPAWELIRVESREVPRDWRARWLEAGGQIRGGRMIALKTDPIWAKLSRFGTPWPPFDFGSGMGAEVTPIEKDFTANLERDVSGMNSELRGALEQLFGPQIDVAGDKIAWKNDAKSYERDTAFRSADARNAYSGCRSVFERVGRRISGSEVEGGLETGTWYSTGRTIADVASVEISAVATGRKTLFHEALGEYATPDLAAAIQDNLPAGVVARVEEGQLYVYHAGLVSRLADQATPIWEQVRKNRSNGRWLGYGMNVWEKGPRVHVRIVAPDGKTVAGFSARPEDADLYAKARLRDWLLAKGQGYRSEVLPEGTRFEW